MYVLQNPLETQNYKLGLTYHNKCFVMEKSYK